MLDHSGSYLSHPNEKERAPVPALPPYIIEPIWEQFTALLPEREINHPLGCHRSRIPDRVVFEKLVQVLVFGCAYRRIADGSCSATTLRDRRDEWIACGVIEKLRRITLEAYDRFIGLESWPRWPWTAALQKPLAVARRQVKARWIGEKAGHQTLDGGGWTRHPHRGRHRWGQSPRLAAFGPHPGAR
jgi:transposase